MALNSSEKKILIVEDEQIIAHSIERSLSKAGYVVPATAASAKEAFELIESTNPDLILMDIHIQGPSDGVETAKVIRERYRLPVIYLTAHADAATLERAKVTEPLGYLVKPLNHTSLPSSIEMALYKHKMDRQLEEHRAMLSTILQSLAEAVLVTNAAGEIEFMNRAAEALTGWSQLEAAGHSFETLLGMGNNAAPLISKALAERKTQQIGREATIRTRQGNVLFVEGQIAISQADTRMAGAMITLHDATLLRQEEQQIRQEQKMLSIAQLASDVAKDFCGLFDLVTSCGEELLSSDFDVLDQEHTANLIQQAGSAGASMARQLLEFGKHQGVRSEPVQLIELVERNKSFYHRLCGPLLSIETDFAPDLQTVLSHSSQMEQLVLNLLLSAKHAMPQGGKIVVRARNIAGPEHTTLAGKTHVRLSIESERRPAAHSPAAGMPARNPELTLAIVNSIVTVCEGTIKTSYIGEASVTDVFLPAMTNVESVRTTVERRQERRSVLMVGLGAEWAHTLRAELEKCGFTVLESGNAQEALLVSEFFESTIDLIVVESAAVPAFSQRRIFGVVSSRWPDVRLLALSSQEPHTSIPKATVLARPFRLEDVVSAIRRLVSLRVLKPVN